jgi:hypothetical protein
MVEVSLAGEWIDDERGRGVYDPISGWRYNVPKEAVIKVLERADDPKVGELRREDHDDSDGAAGGRSIWQVQEDHDGERFWCCVYSTAPGNRDVRFKLDTMLDLPVVGYVPGSPAAYAAATKPSGRVVRDPVGLGERLWRDLNRYARQGDLHAAAGVLSLHTAMSGDDAIAYVKDMSEYQAYLSEHGEETRTLHVHPHVWKSLGAWLHSMRIRLVPQPDGQDRAYGMEPVDGGWS